MSKFPWTPWKVHSWPSPSSNKTAQPKHLCNWPKNQCLCKYNNPKQEQSALSKMLGSKLENLFLKTEESTSSESPWRHRLTRTTYLDGLFKSGRTSLFRNLLIIGLNTAAWEQWNQYDPALSILLHNSAVMRGSCVFPTSMTQNFFFFTHL